MANNFVLLVYYFAVVHWVFAGRIEYQDCEGITNSSSNVTLEMSDCPSGSNCTLVKGYTYYMTTKFTLQENVKNMLVRVSGVMGRVRMPYTKDKPVCSEVTTEDGENCDPQIGFQKGKSYSHVLNLPVRNIFPEISMRIRTEYFDSSRLTDNSIKLCFEVPIKIK
nr:NPC intracellular cholesterol transporter 2-like [Parasteatoda tepidariorum]